MKFLKNNKGVTGIDLAISILIIIVSVTLITIMYSRYIEKSREVERNTMATNIAMQVIEEIKNTDFEDIDDTKIEENFGVTSTAGYTIRVKKIDEIENISIKLRVEVEYKIGDKTQKTELSTTKSKEYFSANVPDLTSEEVKNLEKDIDVDGDGTTEKYTRYFLKYSNAKNGHIEAKASDDDWYSISGKKIAVIAYAKESPIPFNTNGVINFKECAQIYVWVPRFGEYNANYMFCNEATDNPIIYDSNVTNLTVSDSTYSVVGYVVENTISIETLENFEEDETGKWIQVNSDLNPITEDGTVIVEEDNILNILKTEEFTWNK